jgi:hypothetical protein
MYYSAYQRGFLEMKEKIYSVREELIKEGENIPEMILI